MSKSLFLEKSRNRRRRDSLAAAFDQIDTDGDGYISPSEYDNYLKVKGYNFGRRRSLTLLQLVDKDNDGRISKDELLEGKNRVMSPTDGVTGDTRYFKRDEIKNKVFFFG